MVKAVKKEMVKDGKKLSRQFKIGQNGLKWSIMIQNGSKWSKMVKNGKNGKNGQKWSKWSKMVQLFQNDPK